MDKQLGIITEGIQTDGKDSYHFHRYEPTPYSVLDEIFHDFSITANDTVIDYGCGKGRLNFYLSNQYGCSTVGIEMMDQYYEEALKNLQTYKGKNKGKISFVCTSATDYEVSEKENIYFFFNPFSVEIFKKVVSKITQSKQASQRTVTIILYYPDYDYIHYLENSTPFVCIKEGAASDKFVKDRRERYMIYQW